MMSTKNPSRYLTVLALACGVSLVAWVLADDGAGDTQQGGDIQGTEHSNQEIILTATSNAPPGATGQAHLEVEDEDGTNTATLGVETEGLDGGTYTVNVTTKSTGTNFVLGTFDVGISADSGDSGDTNDNAQTDLSVRMPGSDGTNTEGGAEFGTDSGFPLPDGLNPMDIGTLSVLDSNSVVVLTGDFTSVTNGTVSVFNANVEVTDASSTNVLGHAVLHSLVKKGKTRSKFLFVAQGAPPNSVLTLDVNGSDVGTVQSDRHGKVMIKSLPQGVDPSTLTSLELLDSGSNVVFSASF